MTNYPIDTQILDRYYRTQQQPSCLFVATQMKGDQTMEGFHTPAWLEGKMDQELLDAAMIAIITMREQIETIEATIRRLSERQKD